MQAMQLLIQNLTMTESKRAARDQRAPKLDGSQKFDVKVKQKCLIGVVNSVAPNSQPKLLIDSLLRDVPNRSNLSATPPNPNARCHRDR